MKKIDTKKQIKHTQLAKASGGSFIEYALIGALIGFGTLVPVGH